MTSQFEDFSRNDTGWSGLLYKSPNAAYVHKLVRMDYPSSSDMRAPGAATGVYALECAMDELAVALKLDPLELRLRCYSVRDQNEDVPFTSKELRECYRQGAAAFGWDKRTPELRSMRDGKELVGWGMATGVWEALQVPMAARIVLTANGHAEVASAASDIGTGTYTIMAQVAADMLGGAARKHQHQIGVIQVFRNHRLRRTLMAGRIGIACHRRDGRRSAQKLLQLAKNVNGSPLVNAKLEGRGIFKDGMITSKQGTGLAVSFADAMRQGGLDRIRGGKNGDPPGRQATRTQHALGRLR